MTPTAFLRKQEVGDSVDNSLTLARTSNKLFRRIKGGFGYERERVSLSDEAKDI